MILKALDYGREVLQHNEVSIHVDTTMVIDQAISSASCEHPDATPTSHVHNLPVVGLTETHITITKSVASDQKTTTTRT